LIVPHVSIFDPVVIGAVMPYHVPGVELDTHFAWPLYGRIIRALQHFPISHTSPLKSRETLKAAEHHLRAGDSLIVFPEGRRTRSGQRGDFGLWAFRLATAANARVYPIRFEGALERHRTETFDIIPGVWRVHVLEPQYAIGTDRNAAITLRDSVIRAIDTP
jgi:1-acyl-sn-glycerol-3-phosphate acyltransferase